MTKFFLLSLYFSKLLAHGGVEHDHSSGFLDTNAEITDHDLEHLKSSLTMDKPIKDMSRDEKHFFYFKQADTDDDDRLDGLEILQNLQKFEEEDADYYGLQTSFKTDNEWCEVLDRALSVQDLDDDGFVSFWEFQAIRDKARR